MTRPLRHQSNAESLLGQRERQPRNKKAATIRRTPMIAFCHSEGALATEESARKRRAAKKGKLESISQRRNSSLVLLPTLVGRSFSR